MELRLPPGLRATEGHQQAENPSSRSVPAGVLTLRGLAVDGAPVPLGGWVGRGPARAPVARGAATRIAFRFDPPGRALVRPRQATDAGPLPVLVDPGTARGAARGGLLPVSVGGVPLRARVVGTLRRFPTLDPGAEGLVVADAATLRTALAADAPGTGGPDELWLQVAAGAPERRLRAALRTSPVRVTSRRVEQARLREDPLARELARTLGLAALVALATAAVGVVLAGVLRGPRRGGGARRPRGARRRAGNAALGAASPCGAARGPRARRRARAGRRAPRARRPRGRAHPGGHAAGSRPRSRGALGDLGARGLGARRDGRPRDRVDDATRVRGGRAVTAIEVRELSRVHRTAEGDAAALQGLTLRVARGEVVAVLGPSGSGKSTLLRVLAGLELPSAGRAEVLGTDVGRLRPGARAAFRAAHLGWVDQHPERALPPALPCEEAVGLGLALRGVGAGERRARAQELLERVGLADRAAALPAELSGGERQRVAVCAALAHRPGVLLADEPGGELDAAAAAATYALLTELAREHGTAVVLVTHDPRAAAVADRAVGLRDGRIAEETREGHAALVVGRGGWVRLPEELLDAAGLGRRLLATPAPGTLTLTAAPGGVGPVPARPPEPPPRATGAARGRAALQGVRKAFGGRVVLAGLDLEVEPGTLTALWGRSGSGKTTVLRLLAGLEQPDAGRVLVAGEELQGRTREQLAAFRREHVALVTQATGLVDHLTARENVALALTIRGVDARTAQATAEERLAELGLAERTRQRVGRLSGGERQRVALARALAPRPALLLVDEPTSRLDAANAAAVAALLADVARRDGTTVLCATHEELVRSACDAVVELGPGLA